MKKLKFLNLWLTAGFLLTLGVFVLSLAKLPPSQSDLPHLDKMAHFLIYLCLAFWYGQIFLKSQSFKIFSGLFFMGLIIEFIQWWLPFRSFEFYDLIANFLGNITGLFITYFIYGHLFLDIEKKFRL